MTTRFRADRRTRSPRSRRDGLRRSLGLSTALIAIGSSCVAQTTSGADAPGPTGSRAAPSAGDSSIQFTMTVPLSPLFGLIESAVPKQTDNTAHPVEYDGVNVKYKIWRDPLGLAYTGTTLALRDHLYYSLDASTRILGREIDDSCGETGPPGQVLASSDTTLTLHPNWTLETNTTVNPLQFLNPCKITALKLDVTGLISGATAPLLQQATAAIADQFRTFDLYPPINRAWQAIQAPMPVGSLGWFLFDPITARASQIHGSGDTAMVTVGMTGRARVAAGDRPSIVAGRLPSFESVLPSDGFRVDLTGDLPAGLVDQQLVNRISAVIEGALGSGTTPSRVPGDLDGNGVVDVRDAALGLKMAVGVVSPSPDQLARGDVNGDGRIDIRDVVSILRTAVGL